MALTVVQSGTLTPTVNVETNFFAAIVPTNPLNYVLVVDTGQLVATEQSQLTIYTIVLSAGTERVAYQTIVQGVEGDPIKYSVPVPTDISIRATLKQLNGTQRAHPWKLFNL